MWKASDADLAAHAEWISYMTAYEKMLGRTSTEWAPWYIVPADRKWVARAVIGRFLTRALEAMKLKYPKQSTERQRRLAEFAKQLKAEHD
jgi:polyphosphate kinase 2 (PPK2 family)